MRVWTYPNSKGSSSTTHGHQRPTWSKRSVGSAASGQALPKTAYVVVALVLKLSENRDAALRDSPDWKTLYQTVATLRSIDEAFVSQIECAVVEEKASRGRKRQGRGRGGGTDGEPPLTGGIEGIRIRGATRT